MCNLLIRKFQIIYIINAMKKKLHKFCCSLLAFVAAFTALQASATPQVEAEVKEVTTNTITLTFTPNSEVKEYYVVEFDKGTMEESYAQWQPASGVMFGFQWNSPADMIKTWGKASTGKSTSTWKDLAPGEEYDFCIASYDAAGKAAPLQTYTFKTLTKGGSGASVISIDIKEFTQEQGVYKQRIVCTANDQTSRFYSQPFPDVWTDEEGVVHRYSAENAKAYLMDLYEDRNTRDMYALYDVDDWKWELDYAAKYHATAMGLNANGEWGEMTDLVFTTPGYVDPQAASFWWGYGDGKTQGTSYGASGNATRTAAIKIPAHVLAAYDGATISDIRFAVAGEGSCTDVSYFVIQGKSDNGDANFDLLKTYADHSVAVGTLKTGWHQFKLDTPITINSGDVIYIGYTATGARPICIAPDMGMEGSCIMNSGKKFYDYGTMDGYEYTLACQVMINATNIKAAVALDDLPALDVETGKPYEISGKVTSLTPVAITSYLAQLKVDGVAVKQTTVKCDMPEKDTTSSFTFKVNNGLTEGEHTYSVSILALNGDVLDEAVVKESTITAHDLFLTRRHVFEDFTGTWCQYCPRAAAGLESMKKAHPNEVIVIGVHRQDDFAIADYDDISVSGYPTVFLNREDKCGGGSFAENESYFQKHKDLAVKGESKILVAQYTDNTRSKVALIIDSRFAKDYDEHNFRLGFVVTEDDLPAYQSSAPDLGPSGYVQLQDVARSYKSYAGIVGSIPEQIKAGEHYYYRYDLAFPSNVRNRNKAHIIVLLQNKQSNREGTLIANADIIDTIAEPGTYDLTGIDTVLAPGAAPSNIFDLSGRRISVPQRGQISVQNGRKQIR